MEYLAVEDLGMFFQLKLRSTANRHSPILLRKTADLTTVEIAAIDAAGAKGPPFTANTVVHRIRPVTLGYIWPSQEAFRENIYRVSALYTICAAALLVGFMYCLRLGWMC
jgi:hypothetical protein